MSRCRPFSPDSRPEPGLRAAARGSVFPSGTLASAIESDLSAATRFRAAPSPTSTREPSCSPTCELPSLENSSRLLPKLVHVELYNDALSVFQEGRENPNFYKVTAPQYFLFYVNWILEHNG